MTQRKRAVQKRKEESIHDSPSSSTKSKRLKVDSPSSSTKSKRLKVDSPSSSTKSKSCNGSISQSSKRTSLRKKKSEEPSSSAASSQPTSFSVKEETKLNKRSSLRKKETATSASSKPLSVKKEEENNAEDAPPRFVGEPLPSAEARQRWPERYEPKKDECEGVRRARCHYTQAEVDGIILNLNDDVYVAAGEGEPDYIAKIVEFFEAVDKEPYFKARWFYRAEDTVIKMHSNIIDKKRVFFSDVMDDNHLDCIVAKIKILPVPSNVNVAKVGKVSECDYYCNMTYSVPFSTIANLPIEFGIESQESTSTISSETSGGDCGSSKSDMSLLDLYCGCGAMSTGLCQGAGISGVNLITRWAVDMNQDACDSFQLNHPDTKVRNGKADDFLALLKEWEKLCAKFSVLGIPRSQVQVSGPSDEEEDEDVVDLKDGEDREYEVDDFLDICFGDPNKIKKIGLYFKVSWKGFGSDFDTWEPIEGLMSCEEKMRNFVIGGYKSNILPLPGDVDVICGGPPCQGVSGFNRFRNTEAPLKDARNSQLIVFMDIVDFLKPKYVLMENVVDMLKFSGGSLGRYALSRLVAMNYQARLGMMAAGSYGLPQHRLRVFMWGACPDMKLPQYPLPTHEVLKRGLNPNEFELNAVLYDENQPRNLEGTLRLGDAISDLPPVTNSETRDEMPYVEDANTEFQRRIRLRKSEFERFDSIIQEDSANTVLYDHRPYELNADDYARTCMIPKRKGANFRDLPGVVVGEDNIVQWDKNVERVLLPSGKQLIPDYAMSFVKGKSKKPFGRLWWDEAVGTVVTRPQPHNQTLLHPLQDRVLTPRENARLQGFPDYYKLSGPVVERYKQVGNAVAFPAARALGYALGMAYQRKASDEPLFKLPPRFPYCL